MPSLAQYEKALREIDEAIRLSPNDPHLWAIETVKAVALSLLGRPDEALRYARKAISHPNATQWAYATRASLLGHHGQQDEARAALAELMKIQPDFSPTFAIKIYPHVGPNDWQYYFDGLRKAGLDIPDEQPADD